MKFGRDIRALTGLRGVAAVYVMSLHYVAGHPMDGPFSTLLSHGYLAVDLFFILSGFVMALTYGRMFEAGWTLHTFRQFLGRRIARVYPLYGLMTLLAFVLIALGINHGPPVHSMPVALVLNLLMIQSWGFVASFDGPAWSISAEWAAYLLFPAILAPCLFGRASTAWVSAAVSVGAIGVLCMLPPSWSTKLFPSMLLDLHVPTYGLPIVRCLSEFALGVLTFRAARTPRVLALATRPAAALAIAAGVLVCLCTPAADFWAVVLFPLLILSLTSEANPTGRVLASRPVEFLGQLSYSIYLTHDLMSGMMGVVRRTVEGFGLQHGQSYAAVAGAAMTFAFSYFCFHVIERPGRAWLRRVFERRAPMPILTEPSVP